MRADCHVCISEGFRALTRVIVSSAANRIIATLNVVNSDILAQGEVSLSTEAMKRLGISEGHEVLVSHLHPIDSLSRVRAKIFGKTLTQSDYSQIITDVVAGHYSNIEIAAFVTACAGENMNVEEMSALTKAMIDSGTKITWKEKMILDKHSVGGLPGNRTTPIIVSIVAAAGLIIPKTSSRAITSPAGTADVMQTITEVDLTLEQIKSIVEQEGGCLAWGGAVKLSPADDLLIAVEKALDIDSDGQMIASVLSKKLAAGSTHILIDIPVGATAKIRSHEQALKLQYYFKAVSEFIGICTEVIISDGNQPVGNGIGPVLEALDVIAVLSNEKNAPQDLRNRSLDLAAGVLKLSGKFAVGTERVIAEKILDSGQALEKFKSICMRQGRYSIPEKAKYFYEVRSEKTGTITAIDCRKLARIAKLAGAPAAPAAGVYFNVYLGKKINYNDLLFTIYAESGGELEYAKKYLGLQKNFITIDV